jgi:hypothetical protein
MPKDRKQLIDAPAPPRKQGSRVVLGRAGSDTTPPPDHEEFKHVRDWGFRSLKGRIQSLKKKR